MNGTKFLLDSNIIIGYLKRTDSILALFQDKHLKLDECAYSAITRIELLSFPYITATEKQAIETLLSRMSYLAITTEIENTTIQYRLNHKTKLPDAIIAATAQQHGLELLTMDKQLASKI